MYKNNPPPSVIRLKHLQYVLAGFYMPNILTIRVRKLFSIEMAFETRSFSVTLIHTFLWSLFTLSMAGHGDDHLEPCDYFHQSFREGLNTGLIFSITSVIVIYVSYCVPWAQVLKQMKKKSKKELKDSKQMCKPLSVQMVQKGNKEPCRSLAVDFLEKRSRQITEEENLTWRMNFIELCYVTEYFSVDNAIGVGKMGIMYKAKLPNGCFLAVKRPYDSELFKEQFDLEIMILGRYRHRNIVPLLGFCNERAERKERILVYKYMSNGRLSDWVSDGMRLEWPMRVRIALGIARGLSWLHHSLFTVHHSITSKCVLLDENFEPKLSNFAEAKFINQNNYTISVVENGSNNETGFEKKDVYGFGAVLFELITGREFKLITVWSCNPSNFHDAIDKTLIGKGYEDEIFSLLRVALDCLQFFRDKRPTMLEIYNKMSNMWERHELNEDSETSMQTELASVLSGGDEIVELET